MSLVGIDLGLDGGIAFLSRDARVLGLYPMPTRREAHGKRDVDVNALDGVFEPYAPQGGFIELCALEWVHSFGTEARSALFRFGVGTGKVLGYLDLKRVPYVEPTPQAWKAEVLAGTDKSKAAAIGYCLSRWPGVEGLIAGGGKRLTDGLADALCLSEYARRQLLGRSS